MLRRGNAIGRLLHYTKNSLSSPCTSLRKHEQKDGAKKLAETPDHIYIDFGFIENSHAALPNKVTASIVEA